MRYVCTGVCTLVCVCVLVCMCVYWCVCVCVSWCVYFSHLCNAVDVITANNDVIRVMGVYAWAYTQD